MPLWVSAEIQEVSWSGAVVGILFVTPQVWALFSYELGAAELLDYQKSQHILELHDGIQDMQRALLPAFQDYKKEFYHRDDAQGDDLPRVD